MSKLSPEATVAFFAAALGLTGQEHRFTGSDPEPTIETNIDPHNNGCYDQSNQKTHIKPQAHIKQPRKPNFN